MLWLVYLGLLGGCGDTGTSSPTDLYTLSQSVNFDALTHLGPHVYSAEMKWSHGDPVTRSTTESIEILWGDWDNFQTTRSRDGRVVAQTRMVGGRPYVRVSESRYRAPLDGELYRVELRQGWNFWGRALAPFGANLLVSEPNVVLWEERDSSLYELSQPDGQEVAPTEIDVATVTVDKATAVRLSGEFIGSYFESGDVSKPVSVELEFSRTNIGRIPTIEVPQVTVE